VNDVEGAGELSVVMPCFNEAATVVEACKRVLASPYCGQLIVVDDASTDRSASRLTAIDDPRLTVLKHDLNRGKGAALRTGFTAATGPYVIVQDADLEYDPADYEALVQPLVDGLADVVFGSRFQSHRPHRVLYFWHSVGNKLLTLVSNAFTNLNLTDMETGYKAFRKEVLDAMDLREDRFGIEPEITAKAAAGGWRIYEVGISYSGRTYAEGKKIGWRDGVHALVSIVRWAPAVQRLSRR
jgi:glycosyltransferase involved in cell wall biosynthesis